MSARSFFHFSSLARSSLSPVADALKDNPCYYNYDKAVPINIFARNEKHRTCLGRGTDCADGTAAFWETQPLDWSVACRSCISFS